MFSWCWRIRVSRTQSRLLHWRAILVLRLLFALESSMSQAIALLHCLLTYKTHLQSSLRWSMVGFMEINLSFALVEHVKIPWAPRSFPFYFIGLCVVLFCRIILQAALTWPWWMRQFFHSFSILLASFLLLFRFIGWDLGQRSFTTIDCRDNMESQNGACLKKLVYSSILRWALV